MSRGNKIAMAGGGLRRLTAAARGSKWLSKIKMSESPEGIGKGLDRKDGESVWF